MNKTIDFFIDSKNDLAEFEYYFEEELNIKSVTLKSIMFYVAYVDLKKGIIYKEDVLFLAMDHHSEIRKEINLKILCDVLNDWKKEDHVKFHSDKYHLIIELLEDKIFTLPDTLPDIFPDFITFNELFGFTQKTFNLKGKYRSPKSVIGTPILYLRSNLVDKQNTFYNNKYSDILCHFPADIDKDAQKLKIYEPLNCIKNVNKCTNHLKFEITDENGKVINFRGKPVKIHLSFEVFPLNRF